MGKSNVQQVGKPAQPARSHHFIRPTAVALAVATCFSGSFALANPTNPTVVHGTASFATAGNILNITNSANAIINWGSFSINVNELTRFIQPSALSAVLNRVTGQDPSAILGALQSNGRVFLINPNGITFGAGAQIDVAGLVASSLKMSNEDFLNNRMRFTDGAGAGSVVNQGSITGGSVYLVGNAVRNEGAITTTPGGEVVLAAGNSVELVNPGTPDLRVEITAPDNEARNLGAITAEAGRIGIYAGLINNGGRLNANSAVVEGGRIVLKATQNTTLAAGSSTTANGVTGGSVTVQSGDTTLVSGEIAATGNAGQGGTAQVLGNQVGLLDSASVDASGAAGGGTVLVGGDFQGNNPEMQNAYRAYVGPGATIKADAIAQGDGGKVVVWSDDSTRFHGNISARGGAAGGDGGFVEVSGKRLLSYTGLTDTRAPNGVTGILLLDPTDITIDNGGITNGSFDGDPFYTNNDPSSIQWSVIADQLLVSNAIIQTSAYGGGLGDITIAANSPILNSIYTLDLRANNNIAVNGSITGTGDLKMYAGYDDNFSVPGVYNGTGNIVVSAPISMGNQIRLTAGNNVTVNNNLTVIAAADTTGDIYVNAVGGSIDVNNATLSATGGNSIFNYGGSGAVSLYAPNGITVTNSTIQAQGGHYTPADAAYGGGYTTVNLDTSGPAVISGSNILATGGSGAWGGSADIGLYGDTVSINGSMLKSTGGIGTFYNGGYADLYVRSTQVGSSGTTIDIANSTLQAIGGAGAPGFMQGAGYLWIQADDGDINISNSTIASQGGYYAETYINAYNGAVTLTNSSVSATAPTGADGGEGHVGIYAQNNIDTGTSAVSAVGMTSAEGGEAYYYYGTGVDIYAGGNVNLGQVTSSDYVDVYSGGAITDGNAGLNIGALYAYLEASNGVGSVANPLETQVAMLDVYTNTGGIGIINSGDLALGGGYANGFYAGSGDVAIGTTGSLAVVDGAEGVASGGNLSLGANGHLGIYGYVNASGSLFLQSGGDMEIGNTGAYSTASAMGGTGATAVAGGSLTLNPNMYMDPSFLGSYGGNTTVTTGGNVTVNNSFISGNPDVMMTVGGVVNINGTSEFPGGIEADVPLTIYLTFPKGLSGGYFINGIEGVVYDPATGTGFIAGGNPAILGTNLKVTYNGVVPTLSPPTDTLIVAMGESTKPPDPDKDKDIFKEQEDDEKKNAPVCR